MPIKVFDKFGNLQSWEWLEQYFGKLVIYPAGTGWGWRVVEIREIDDIIVSQMEKGVLKVGDFTKPSDLGVFTEAMADITTKETVLAPAVCVVKHLEEDGSPASDYRSCWYWPNAPQEPECIPIHGVAPGMTPGISVSGMTNDNGDIGHAMGGGAWYDPATQIGPHAIFVCGENSDVVLGIGMIFGTNHKTLWFVLQWSYVTEDDLEDVVRRTIPTLRDAAVGADKVAKAAAGLSDILEAAADELETALPIEVRKGPD
jgi:hypothetical protein